MDVVKATEGLQAALDTAQKLAPVAVALGMPEQVADIANVANAAVSVASNLAERINEGRIVASSGDADKVRAILAGLQAENDKLAAAIDAS
jgi:hypothetical protein